MPADEQYSLIMHVLGNVKRTTREIEAYLDKAGSRCPDDLARTLNVMRRKGLIKGEVSVERGGWVWWVEDQP